MRKDYIEMLEAEIGSFLVSDRRREMAEARRYYAGDHDAVRRMRTAVDRDGRIVTLDKLPCARIVDNQYCRLVDQKVNYSLGRPLTVDCEDREFASYLTALFARKSQRLWRRAATDAINCGVSFLHPYLDGNGELRICGFDPYYCIPFFSNAARTELDMLVRLCPTEVYTGRRRDVLTRVFAYTKEGVDEFEYKGGGLLHKGGEGCHFYDKDGGRWRWDRTPVIPLYYSPDGVPMIRRAKCLQDAINELMSDFCDCMTENGRSSVLVLKDFDGEDLGEFRRNLAVYGAVKVGSEGGVDTLEVEVNADNYDSLKSMLTEALTECCRGFDAHDGRLGSNPNRMNVLAMYSDIDLDANGFEVELSAAFDEVIAYARSALYYTGRGDYRRTPARVICNRDLLINESDVISSLAKSKDIVSPRTLVLQHPLVDDVNGELDKLGLS